MDQEVEPAPDLLHRLESGIDRGGIGDVAVTHDDPVELLRQRSHALFERLALEREGQFGAGGPRRLGDAPGDGSVVGEAHDEATTAGQHGRSGGGRGDGQI